MNKWSGCKNILCIRLDNMGDLLMSEPAIRALKETFNCKITVLTSSMAKGIAKFIQAIDEVLVYDASWVKSDYNEPGNAFLGTVNVIKAKQFDAAVIFTVFSQNPLPAAMLAWLAGIPRRLAYCRENPYDLLTDWVPEQEPYNFVQHQVMRDLNLVKSIGASVSNNRIQIGLKNDEKLNALKKLADVGVTPDKPWLVLHPGVSEEKRQYPMQQWTALGKKIVRDLHYDVIVTGAAAEKNLTDQIATSVGNGAFSCAGLFTLGEFIALIAAAPLVICVNTSTAHLAAATQTKVIVLYALTNPQHSPWRAQGFVFPFLVTGHLRSKNEVLQYVQREYFKENIFPPSPDEVFGAAHALISNDDAPLVPQLITFETRHQAAKVADKIAGTGKSSE